MLVHVLPLCFACHLKHVLHVKWIYLSFKNVCASLTSSLNTTEAIMMRGYRGEQNFLHYPFDGLSQSGELARGNGLPIIFMGVFDVTWAACDYLDYVFKNGSFFGGWFVWKGCSSWIGYLAWLNSWYCFLLRLALFVIVWWMLERWWWFLLRYYARLSCFIVCRFAWNLWDLALVKMRRWPWHTVMSPWCASCLLHDSA